MLAILLMMMASSQAAPRPPKPTTAPVAAVKPDPSDFNPSFGFTHQLPTPLTLPAGRFAFGSYMAYGLTSFLTVGTNLYRDFYKVLNASAKVSLYEGYAFAIAGTMGWESYNLKDIDDRNPDLHLTSWQPGLVTAFAITEEVAWFLGGNLNLTEITVNSGAITTSGNQRGAQIGSDISWMYSPASGRHGPQAISTGVSYDITYDLVGIGLSHHWSGFQLGLHYYLNAKENRLQPIIAGGGVVDL